MKKLLMLASCVFALMAMADDKLIAEAAVNPDKMSAAMKSLSAAEQKTFLAQVNAAIAKLPGSNEAKAAKFLAANRAAMKSAKSGNLTTLLAECFATVPPTMLTVISERFAEDLFNRAADASVTYTDEDFTKIAETAMAKVNERNVGNDQAGVRSTFAILMFLRASNGTPADLADKLIATLPEKETRDLAKKSWVPAAMAGGQDRYVAMLGEDAKGNIPVPDVVLRIAGPQMLEAQLAGMSEAIHSAVTVGAISDTEVNILPKTTDQTKTWYPGYSADNAREQAEARRYDEEHEASMKGEK